uniref:Signal peptidase complex subunit 3 n=1 Tax=Rhizochromulina marina TaxID=1034831 RepID=A0A7S2SN40_9STRA|mmetsp:Transcript_32903/g.95237  ORF Transcript_32903/g.95237 Transcript_32903/m.95237 type:complete len:190 (+) Transcript_32903:209-778(+)
MHTVWVRLNAVVFFGLTVIVVLAVLTWFSTVTHRGYPTVDTLQLNSIGTLRNHGERDIAILSFDLHADLSPAFNWNIKQLFVFVVAEYRTKTNPLNQVVLWDRIIERAEDAVIAEDVAQMEYGLIDYGTELRNTTVNLRLVWDHMPITGRLFMDSLPTSSFKLPGQYSDPIPDGPGSRSRSRRRMSGGR